MSAVNDEARGVILAMETPIRALLSVGETLRALSESAYLDGPAGGAFLTMAAAHEPYAEQVLALWERLFEATKADGAKPAGKGGAK